MRIRKINICGFKSFCDDTQIVFDDSVTAVVGPNGCGKSNILDAIRWALGELSPKNLRGKVMEDVIFAGSESRGPMSMAEVTIEFDNSNGLCRIPQFNLPEISVTRRHYRNDPNSEYLINKVPCRRKDVTDLFFGTGGGARAYSIVEQGRIGLIVSARSEDRRTIIEEAAGITKFRSSRLSTERKMDKTRQNLLRVTDVVAEMERNLAGLNRQAKKAERYKRYKAELNDLELHTHSIRYLELRACAIASRESLSKVERELGDAQSAVASAEAGVESLRATEQEARARYDEETAISYELNNRIQIAENELKHLKDKIQSLKEQERSLGEQNATIAGRLEEMRRDSAGLASNAAEIERNREAIGNKNRQIETEVEQTRSRLSALGEAHNADRDKLSRLRARLAAAESAVSNLAARIDETRSRIDLAKEERGSLERKAEDLGLKVTGIESRTTEVEDRLAATRNAEKQELAEYEKLRLEVEACDLKRRQIRDDLQSRSSRKASIEEMMQSLESHDRAVREAVLALKEEGSTLIKGLLIDSVECEERYEMALAAALGERLEALIVDDRDAGLDLLKKLKERDLGRVTAIAKGYSKLPDTATCVPDDTAVVGLLADLIQTSPEAQEILKSLLHGIFVVEDLNTAERLWKASGGNAAFATLDGQLLDADGSMSGGRSGSPGADLLRQKRQVRELTQEINALTSEHDLIEGRFLALKDELAARRSAAEEARHEAQEQAIVLAETRKDMTRIAEDLAALVQSREVLEKEIKRQEEMLAQAQSDRNQAVREVEESGIEIEKLDKLLFEQNTALEALQKESEALAESLSAARVQRAALDQQAETAVERMEQMNRALAEAADEIRRISEETVRISAETGRAIGGAARQREILHEQVDCAEKSRSRMAGIRGEFEKIASDVASAADELKQKRGALQEISDRLSTARIAEREIDIEVSHLLDTVHERFHLDLLRVLGDYHLRPVPDEGMRARIEELRNLIDRIGPINLAAIDDFQTESKRHEQLVVQKADLEQALEDLEQAIARMDRDARRLFKTTFEDVNKRFQELFPKLFKGGRAELVLTDPSDLLATGVDIIAQPPGKKLGNNVELLSGGEKALTAVSLIFAIFLHRPSPFCILDEVDAPLDEANVDRFLDMVHDMTDRSQFIMITHSKLTMERSDALYGVTMEEPGASKIVSVRITDAIEAKRSKQDEIASTNAG